MTNNLYVKAYLHKALLEFKYEVWQAQLAIQTVIHVSTTFNSMSLVSFYIKASPVTRCPIQNPMAFVFNFYERPLLIMNPRRSVNFNNTLKTTVPVEANTSTKHNKP